MPQHTERAAGAQARAGGLQLKRPSVSNFVVIRGLRYHVRSWGREGAPKLFMLHGWMDCSASFQFFAEAFDGDWHLIAPDWRGYGLSEWPARDTYWHPELIGDLDHLLQHYSPEEPVNLMAHSMGGGLLTSLSRQRASTCVTLRGSIAPCGCRS